MNKFKRYLRAKWECMRRGYHDYVCIGVTLGGDWIKCTNCGKTEEYLPGLHEPERYDPNENSDM